MTLLATHARRWAGLALLASLVLSACVTPGSGLDGVAGEGLPRVVQLSDVPFYAQRSDECGPASLAMLLAWSGARVDVDELAAEVLLPQRSGSLQLDLIGAARRHGRLAVPLHGFEELLRELAAGRPVGVLQNLGFSWAPVWHYSVVIGYDLERDSLSLHTGTRAARTVTLRSFENTWRRAERWGLLVLPPGELPESADEVRVLQAVVGLERAGRWSEAERAHAAALARWPGSLPAALGLGNARHARGDAAGAEQAFREASRAHPESEAAWNNLASVLAQRGANDEARAILQRALALRGPLHTTVQRTLAELDAAQRPSRPDGRLDSRPKAR